MRPSNKFRWSLFVHLMVGDDAARVVNTSPSLRV